MSDAPHTPAAFINAIAEEGSKKEAIEWLQKTWNERCQLEREIEALRNDAERLKKLFEYWEADDKEKFCALIAEIRKEAIKEQS